jgi:DNA replication protein DnaD
MTDKNKNKFRISQNLVLIVYISDADSSFNLEEEKAKMLKLLSKTQIEYENNKLGDIYDATDTKLNVETIKYTIKYLKSKGVKFVSKTSKILKNTEKEIEVETKSYVEQYIKKLVDEKKCIDDL